MVWFFEMADSDSGTIFGVCLGPECLIVGDQIGYVLDPPVWVLFVEDSSHSEGRLTDPQLSLAWLDEMGACARMTILTNL